MAAGSVRELWASQERNGATAGRGRGGGGGTSSQHAVARPYTAKNARQPHAQSCRQAKRIRPPGRGRLSCGRDQVYCTSCTCGSKLCMHVVINSSNVNPSLGPLTEGSKHVLRGRLERGVGFELVLDDAVEAQQGAVHRRGRVRLRLGEGKRVADGVCAAWADAARS